MRGRDWFVLCEKNVRKRENGEDAGKVEMIEDGEEKKEGEWRGEEGLGKEMEVHRRGGRRQKDLVCCVGHAT